MVEAADRRDALLLALACAMGGATATLLPMVGLPLAGAGAAGLAYGGRFAVAIFAAAAGVIAAVALRPLDAVFVVPAISAVFVAVGLLPRRSFQAVGLGLVVALFASAVMLDTVAASVSGTTLTRALEDQAARAGEALAPVLGSDVPASQVEALTDTALLLWPSAYFQTALFTAFLTVAAIAWAARRVGRPLDLPCFSELDLSIHVVWALIGGVVLLAAASLAGDRGVLFAAGLNLVAGVRALLLLQGLAVASWVMRRFKLGPFARLALLGVLIVVDTLFFFVSVVGLVDMWANFRRLPRGGTSENAGTPRAEPGEPGI